MTTLYWKLEREIYSVLGKSKILQAIGKHYAKGVEKELRKIGLRYEDLIIETPDVQEALRRLPPDVLEARHKRILRAGDLSAKHTYLPDHIQAAQKPLESYLAVELDKVRDEIIEQEGTGLEVLLSEGKPGVIGRLHK
mmetsp:Transcript_14970/g.25567  ORF Transcript_14970/g.25567 Transcript_14970/m.25567 type:complete len:138 (-) Transcript_14970:216-629(-)